MEPTGGCYDKLTFKSSSLTRRCIPRQGLGCSCLAPLILTAGRYRRSTEARNVPFWNLTFVLNIFWLSSKYPKILDYLECVYIFVFRMLLYVFRINCWLCRTVNLVQTKRIKQYNAKWNIWKMALCYTVKYHFKYFSNVVCRCEFVNLKLEVENFFNLNCAVFNVGSHTNDTRYNVK